MITIHDNFGKEYRLKFEKTKKDISVYLFVGREKYFISVVDTNNDTKIAEIQEFLLEFGQYDCRRKGLGTTISTLLEKQLKEIGMTTVIGNVVEQDKGAEIFWNKQGYEISPCNEGPVRFTIKKAI